MIQSREIDIAVIGGGAAGIAAATKLARNLPDLSITIFERDDRLGGILPQCLHTGFGLSYFEKDLTGPEYLREILKDFPFNRVEILSPAHVTRIYPNRHLVAIHDGIEKEFSFRFLVLATGSREIPFGALAIPSDRPAGILTAGEAQFLMNRQGVLPGKRAVILGAGDIGLIMCRRFLFEGLRVEAIVELRKQPGGMPRNVQTCVHDYGISLLTESTVVGVQGRKRVEGVVVARVDEHGNPVASTARTISCDTLLVAVGLRPEIDLAIEIGVSCSGTRLKSPDNGRTSLPWLFSCGNARLIHPIVDDVSREGERVAGTILELLKDER